MLQKEGRPLGRGKDSNPIKPKYCCRKMVLSSRNGENSKEPRRSDRKSVKNQLSIELFVWKILNFLKIQILIGV